MIKLVYADKVCVYSLNSKCTYGTVLVTCIKYTLYTHARTRTHARTHTHTHTHTQNVEHLIENFNSNFFIDFNHNMGQAQATYCESWPFSQILGFFHL